MEVHFLKACYSSDLDEIDTLVKLKGFNPNYIYADGTTMLMVCSIRGAILSVFKLISLGADPDLRCKERGMTALMYAAISGQAQIVGKLVKYTDTTIKDDNGKDLFGLMNEVGCSKEVKVAYMNSLREKVETAKKAQKLLKFSKELISDVQKGGSDNIVIQMEKLQEIVKN